jgi:AAA domain
LPGSVVILDTLTRFVEGDQNSSEDMSRFAQEVFRLKRVGATVLLLHHSVKGTGNAVALTLDSAMRGSTELAAFVTSCWATRLLDTDEPYQSPSLLVNVKQRDFESKPFETTCGPDCRMHIVGEPGQITELKNAKDAEAEKILAALLKENPNTGVQKLRSALADTGFKKGTNWISKARARILGTGVTTSAA